MKEYIFYAVCAIGFIVVLLIFIYGMRLFNSAATPITVHQVKPDIECATMVTGDGAAIDCWKFER